VELPADSPVHDLPWIVTFGPLEEDDDWEPVVCGPYERRHALSLAEHVVADEDLMAVVEPLYPRVSVAEIRDDISAARLAAEADEDEDDLDSDDIIEDVEAYELDAEDVDEDAEDLDDPDDAEPDEDDLEDLDLDDDDLDGEADYPPASAGPPPAAEEIRAGFTRIAARLTGSAGWS
jgi:hypothetical protein